MIPLKNKWIVLFFLVGVIVLLVVNKNASQKIVPTLLPQIQQIPFKELTIPYLREKKYPSVLGSLTEDFTGSNYTAYLTQYTSENLKINAILTKPTGDMPKGGWPGIIFIHGYIPPTQYVTDGAAYSAYVDYLAKNGFVVFKIDLRGHGNSEGEAGGGYYGADYVTDALSAYTALQGSGFVNPKRIGLWGHSMAGNIVMRSFAAHPSIPAVVIWAGAVYSYVDQTKYGLNDNSYHPPALSANQQNRRRLLLEKVGSPSAKSVFWQQMAPTSYLKDLKGAIQIHHAVDDTVVNIGYSRDLVALLDKTSVVHEFYEYPSGGHNISGESFSVAMQRTVDFFKKYLP
ncbi:MAG TPA: alpha/beta fold hydrolase [Candidatus Eisenbacteria bacterium]|nr:alpha/beta fold hydrolase [Candidatus Eisenbacteria bacterium]